MKRNFTLGLCFVTLLLGACSQKPEKQPDTDSTQSEATTPIADNKKEQGTDELETFWLAFQKDVAAKNKEKLAAYFKFPFKNMFAFFDDVKGEEIDKANFLKYYETFMGGCVGETIAKLTAKDLKKTDKGFQFEVHYPKPKGEVAGDGTAFFDFEKTDNTYQIFMVNCAGGCGGDCE